MTLTGPNKSGKSYLANLFMEKLYLSNYRTTGFRLNSDGSSSPTKGLWIWGKPMILSDGTFLLIIDGEGVNANGKDRDKTIDLKIFVLEVLMSTLLIYNTYFIVYKGKIILMKN